MCATLQKHAFAAELTEDILWIFRQIDRKQVHTILAGGRAKSEQVDFEISITDEIDALIVAPVTVGFPWSLVRFVIGPSDPESEPAGIVVQRQSIGHIEIERLRIPIRNHE